MTPETIVRLIMALFFAVMLGLCFRRAWAWEHGKSRTQIIEPWFGEDRGKETVVWYQATALPLTMGLMLLFSMLTSGPEAGVKRFAFLALDIMLTFSLYFVLLILLLPILRRYFSARACATLWLVPVFQFINFFIIINNKQIPRFTVYIPQAVFYNSLYVWLAGFTVVFGWYLISHLIFYRSIKKNAFPVTDEAILELWQQELERLEYKRPVRLMLSEGVSAPFSMGLMKRTRMTVLPKKVYAPDALRLIFSHEVHHLQRSDVDTKLFLAFCKALCWFNPLVWFATKKAAEDLELSCDEIVVEGMDESRRRQYAQLLLGSAGEQRGFTTSLSPAANTLRYRLKNIMSERKRFKGTLLLMVVLFCSTMCFGVVAVTDEQGSFSELLLPEEIEINYVYIEQQADTRTVSIWAWDEEALRAYLDTIQIEHVSSFSLNPSFEVPSIIFSITSGGNQAFVTLEDGIVRVREDFLNSDYYAVKSDIDWEQIFSCLDFEAERSNKRYDEPDLHLYFSGPDYTDSEPMLAVCSSLYVADDETGEVQQGYSDSPNLISGMQVDTVVLDFSYPPEKLIITATDWDGNKRYQEEFEEPSSKMSFDLVPYSAHYRVDAIYTMDGLTYMATYLFDVELPDDGS